MIVRNDRDTFLLITQPDHAQLAETVVAAMRTEPALDGPARSTILLATREHDNGWAEVDAAPTVNPRTGRPCDFMAGSMPVKHELWLRGITRAAKTDDLAGALVAEHVLTVYSYRRGEREWAAFFSTIEGMRDALLRGLGLFTGRGRDTFRAYYRCVQLGDSFSLQFCNAWTDSSTTLGYRATMQDSTLLISPDPFDSASVDLRVVGHRIPARHYRDDAQVRAALATAIPEIVVGTARGM
jgi:hypothetical protein